MIEFSKKEFFWEYYDWCLDTYKDDAKSCGWIDEKSQISRYSALFQTGIIEENLSILDWGCGNGNLLNFLSDIKFPYTEYLGFDVNPKMISIAKSRFHSNSFTDKLPDSQYDWCVASGIFSIDILEHEMIMIVYSMWKHSKIGVAFNLISDSWSGAGRNLCTWNKSQVLEWVSGNFPKIKVVQGYLDDEDFTVFLLKK